MGDDHTDYKITCHSTENIYNTIDYPPFVGVARLRGVGGSPRFFIQPLRANLILYSITALPSPGPIPANNEPNVTTEVNKSPIFHLSNLSRSVQKKLDRFALWLQLACSPPQELSVQPICPCLYMYLDSWTE